MFERKRYQFGYVRNLRPNLCTSAAPELSSKRATAEMTPSEAGGTKLRPQAQAVSISSNGAKEVVTKNVRRRIKKSDEHSDCECGHLDGIV